MRQIEEISKIRLGLTVFVILLGSIIVLTGYQLIKYSDNLLHVFVCDVGQGDAIFIRTPGGSDIVIDGGPDKSVLTCLSDNMPFWDRKIDIVIVTHGHSDHVSGVIEILKRFDVGVVLTQDKLGEGDVVDAFYDEVARGYIPVREIVAGEDFNVGDVSFRVLWPENKFLHSLVGDYDKNDSSIVLSVGYGEFDFLLTGDIDVEDLIDVVCCAVDFLKVSHQGSYTGTDEDLVRRLRPKLSVISVGENNYGHPHSEVVEVLRKYSDRVMRTDEDGSIEVISDGKKLWLGK